MPVVPHRVVRAAVLGEQVVPAQSGRRLPIALKRALVVEEAAGTASSPNQASRAATTAAVLAVVAARQDQALQAPAVSRE